MSNIDFAKIRQNLITKTKVDLAKSVSEDIIIVQTLASIDDISLSLNNLSVRLKEWAAYTVPELVHKVPNHDAFVHFLTSKSYNEIQSEFADSGSMGAKLSDSDYDAILMFANQINAFYDLRSDLTDYLESILKTYTPNILAVAGTTISARLLSSAGSLRKLAFVPASTVQLYGAEKALFRHLKSGARSPKHGHIFNHPIIQHANRQSSGKVARALADKISICAKLDYFKGEFLGDKYLEELETKFSRGENK